LKIPQRTTIFDAGVVALVVATSLIGSATHPAQTVAAPITCAAAQGAATLASSPVALPAQPIPTETAIAPEVNPPGDIPDNQAFVTYTSADGGYSIAMPEGWARQEDGPNVTFVDKLHRFAVDVTCVDTAPTAETARSVDAAQLAQQVPAFELVEIKPVDLPAGPAMLIRYRTNSQQDEVTGKQIRLDVDRYEIFQNGRLASIALAVPAGSDNVDVSNQISGSFRWTS
jgi:hypothetical protein